MATQRGIRTSRAAGGHARRYAVGDRPKTRPKLAVKLPTLPAPTAQQMSATEQSVAHSRAAARSRRRVSRYWCGDSPNVRLNSRLKCAHDSPAVAASSATERGSAYQGVGEVPSSQEVAGQRRPGHGSRV